MHATHNRRSSSWLLAVILLALPAWVSGDDPVPPAAHVPATRALPASAGTPVAAPGAKARPVRGAGASAGSVQPFVPSETISADTAVAFPVDI